MSQQPLQFIVTGVTAEEIRAKYVEGGKALGLTLVEGEAKVETAAPAATRGRKAKDEKVAAAEEKKEDAPAANILDDAPVVTITKDDVRAVLSDLNNTKGTTVAMAVLKKYDAINLGTLKPEDYGNFIAEAKKELAKS